MDDWHINGIERPDRSALRQPRRAADPMSPQIMPASWPSSRRGLPTGPHLNFPARLNIFRARALHVPAHDEPWKGREIG